MSVLNKIPIDTNTFHDNIDKKTSAVLLHLSSLFDFYFEFTLN